MNDTFSINPDTHILLYGFNNISKRLFLTFAESGMMVDGIIDRNWGGYINH